MMIAGQVGRAQADNAMAVPPGLLNDLVSWAVEVEPVHGSGLDHVSFRFERRTRACLDGIFREQHTRREVRNSLRLGLSGKRAESDEGAVCDKTRSARAEDGFDCDRARFAAVELERSQEIYLLDGFDVPTGQKCDGGFGECLNAHHAWQDRSTVDLVVVEKGLNFRI